MGLINCPECNQQVSNKAQACPNCGYPLSEVQKTAKKSETQKTNKEKSRESSWNFINVLALFLAITIGGAFGKAFVSSSVLNESNSIDLESIKRKMDSKFDEHLPYLDEDTRDLYVGKIVQQLEKRMRELQTNGDGNPPNVNQAIKIGSRIGQNFIRRCKKRLSPANQKELQKITRAALSSLSQRERQKLNFILKKIRNGNANSSDSRRMLQYLNTGFHNLPVSELNRYNFLFRKAIMNCPIQ